MVSLRTSQESILSYQGGFMGISAVPGSGKTWTLSLLAAEIIRSGSMADDQEVLIVTLVNSAVDNFYQRVGTFVREAGLIPNLGYRVRTLHGLAHDIVRERPGLVGLPDNFPIIDEREADSIRNEVARSWLASHPNAFEDYLNPDLDESRLSKIKRDELPELVKEIALGFIRYAKDQQVTPDELGERLDSLPVPLTLAEMGWAMYTDYQRALNYRGAVDFDDLIRLALLALQVDHAFLERLQKRWPYILEDEAQDSSRLQEMILQKLAGTHGNWVRVGDPNQAIYETFTTANPRYLKDFINRTDVISQSLPVSGRSTPGIIYLANGLVEWTMHDHPLEAAREALEGPPFIEPALGNDPQPSPTDDLTQVHLVWRRYSAAEEIKAVADSLAGYLPDHPDATVAVLTPRNQRGIELVDELERRKLPYEDGLLRSSSAVRSSVGVLSELLAYLADPQSAVKLANVFQVWMRKFKESGLSVKRAAELIRKAGYVEDYLWPGPDRDWLQELDTAGEAPAILAQLEHFRDLARRWQAAVLLPVDQLVLTIAHDFLTEPAELAIAHKLASLLDNASRTNPSWRLPEFTRELDLIVKNERRFLRFSQFDTAFEPTKFKGKVVISTIHKAKGLEWDRVYLLSANNYDFPSGIEGDSFLSEKWYLRNSLNLPAETLAQLAAVLSRQEYEWYEEGRATYESRLDYVRERLRLFYVGITRARKELVITWNTGRRGDQEPALPFAALKDNWERRSSGI